jgi:hypothetical protein
MDYSIPGRSNSSLLPGLMIQGPPISTDLHKSEGASMLSNGFSFAAKPNETHIIPLDSSASSVSEPASFTVKLYALLEDAHAIGFEDIILWCYEGKAFKVHKRLQFSILLPPNSFNPKHCVPAQFLTVFGDHAPVDVYYNSNRQFPFRSPKHDYHCHYGQTPSTGYNWPNSSNVLGDENLISSTLWRVSNI